MKVKILKRNKAFSSLPHGSGVKRTLTLCKTIESIETFLNSWAKLVVSACARAHTLKYSAISSPEPSDHE